MDRKSAQWNPIFFRTAHSAIGRGNTDFDVIVVDAKLVGSVFNSGEKIEQSPR